MCIRDRSRGGSGSRPGAVRGTFGAATLNGILRGGPLLVGSHCGLDPPCGIGTFGRAKESIVYGGWVPFWRPTPVYHWYLFATKFLNRILDLRGPPAQLLPIIYIDPATRVARRGLVRQTVVPQTRFYPTSHARIQRITVVAQPVSYTHLTLPTKRIV